MVTLKMEMEMAAFNREKEKKKNETGNEGSKGSIRKDQFKFGIKRLASI